MRYLFILSVLLLAGCESDTLPTTATEPRFKLDGMAASVHILPTGERVLFIYGSDAGGTYMTCCYLPPLKAEAGK